MQVQVRDYVFLLIHVQIAGLWTEAAEAKEG